MNEQNPQSIHHEVLDEVREEQQEKVGRAVCFWIAVLLASVITSWYYVQNPQESGEVQRMRLFFKDNARPVMEFIRLPPEKLAAAAKKHQHPFYMSYVKASVNEREKIKALIHISVDYSPNQYWFNIFFLWTIVFTTVWFIALITQGVIIQIRRNPNLT